MDPELEMLVADMTAEERLEMAKELEQAALGLMRFDLMWPCALPESALQLLSHALTPLSPHQLEQN